MAVIDQIPDGTARELLNLLGDGTLKFLLSVHSSINDTDTELTGKADLVDNPTIDNILVVDADGNPKDSGKDLPNGNVIGDTDTQTLTNKTLTEPTIADLSNMQHDHKSAEKGGDYDWADMTQAATQSDAVAASSLTLNAGADSVDRAAFNTALGTLITEINAIKDVVNALVDKMQIANLMT